MHIGQLSKEQVEKHGKTVVWFANELSCSRTNIYKIYEKSSIDTSLLLRISSILEYDFFSAYTEKLEEKDWNVSPMCKHANFTGTLL